MPASYFGGGGSGSSAFGSLTGGTNTSAAMVVGSGASLSTTGSGTIAATSVSTNANLTGVVTSVGNATSFATSPTFTGTLTAATSTFSGAMSVTTQVAASVAPVSVSNTTWTVGSGTGTTTVPQLYINGSGSAPSTWSTSGTGLGVNMPSSSGNAIDVHAAGGNSIFSISGGGSGTFAGTVTTQTIQVQGGASAGAWTTGGRAVRIIAANFTDTSSSGTVAVTAINAFAIPTLLASSATTYSDSANVYIAGAPTTSGGNVTQTRAWALYIAAGNLFLGGLPKFGGTNSTGAGVTAVGTNCPAVTASAPYTWFSVIAADGSACFLPAWK